LADAPFIPVHRTGFSGAVSINSPHSSSVIHFYDMTEEKIDDL